jgi:hypothetical protein
MNAYERRPLTAETAEQLLDGHPDAWRHARGLAERLAAASTAALPVELAGEDDAAAAYIAASAADLARLTGRKSMMNSAVVAKLLTLKTAAIAVTAVSAGGVALAASAGVLPNPLAPQNPGHSTDAPDRTGGPNASPSLVGLCTAYLAGAGADHGKALENPAFTALITAAGGKDRVETFCGGLGVTAPGSGRGNGPTEHPSGEASHPSPTKHPTGEPGHPTGTPTHPTGPPATSHPDS